MNKVYFREIDIMKGIGIFLVVLGHLNTLPGISKVIYGFHMPLFFFISGFVFNKKSSLVFIKEKFNRILVPYIFFSVLTFLLYYIPNYNDSKFKLSDLFIGTLLGVSNDYYLSWNVVLWFLPSLFLINIIFNFAVKYSRVLKFIALGVLLLGGVIFNKDDLYLPFHLGSSILMIPFFASGFFIKANYKNLMSKINMIFKPLIILISFAVISLGVLISFQNIKTPDVRINIIGNPLLFYFGAILTIIGVLLGSRYVNSKTLIWLGVNSLSIMCIHLKLKGIATQFIHFIGFEDHYRIITAILIILLCVPFVYFFKKYLPFKI